MSTSPGIGYGGPVLVRAEVETKTHAVLQSGRVLVIWSTHPPTPEVHDAMRRAFRYAIAAAPGRAILFYVIEPRDLAARRDDKMRADIVEFAREFRTGFAHAAVVLATQGFVSAVLRGFFTGAVLVARPSGQVRVFDDTVTGLRWLSGSIDNEARTTLEALARRARRT